MTRGAKIHTVCIEGPDLSGKTRLYSSLHKESNYRWNIQDRAEVSMLCFARFYNRNDQDKWEELLSEKLKDINHRYILLLPDMELLKERYLSRGDEIHTFESLCATYKMFAEYFDRLKEHPNVLCLSVSEDNQDIISNIAYDWLSNSESENLENIAARITNVASFFKDEALGVRVQYDFDKNYRDADPAVMDYEPERKYYQGIREKFIRKITKEIAGENEYVSPQNPETTRRFVYAHDSCISIINCLIRENVLNAYVVLRSSNARDTLPYDLKFIANLISEAESFIGVDVKRRVLNVVIHSAHIIN